MMACISSFGLYLLATLMFLSGANHSLALTNNAAENISRAAHPKETSQIDRLELAMQTTMETMEDGFARTEREVAAINGKVASLKEALEEGMKSSLEDGLKSLEEKLSHAVDTISSSVTDIVNNATVCPTELDPPSNCQDLQNRGHSSSGVYSVTISGKNVKVYCDMITDGGGWTVITNRDNVKPHMNFDREWEDYKKGFGDLEGEFWLGLDNIHGLTSDPSTPMMLRVEMEDWKGEKRAVLHLTFRVGGEEENYWTIVGLMGVNHNGGPGDKLTFHKGETPCWLTLDREEWKKSIKGQLHRPQYN